LLIVVLNTRTSVIVADPDRGVRAARPCQSITALGQRRRSQLDIRRSRADTDGRVDAPSLQPLQEHVAAAIDEDIVERTHARQCINVHVDDRNVRLADDIETRPPATVGRNTAGLAALALRRTWLERISKAALTECVPEARQIVPPNG
jgi:hypothetical protein